jgi:hypothetical protein
MTHSHIRERSVAKVLCCHIETITQIVSIERSRPEWLPSLYPNAAAEYAAPSQSNVRKITFSQWSLAYWLHLRQDGLEHLSRRARITPDRWPAAWFQLSLLS